jgi:hypothetical protein
MANRIGEEPMGAETAHFRGESQIVDCGGNAILNADGEECVKIAEIKPGEVKVKRNVICDDMSVEMRMYEKSVKYYI